MTDRINSLTVVLAEDVRVDDIQPTVDAILHIKGVLSVSTNISASNYFIAEERVRAELKQKLRDALWGAM